MRVSSLVPIGLGVIVVSMGARHIGTAEAPRGAVLSSEFPAAPKPALPLSFLVERLESTRPGQTSFRVEPQVAGPAVSLELDLVLPAGVSLVRGDRAWSGPAGEVGALEYTFHVPDGERYTIILRGTLQLTNGENQGGATQIVIDEGEPSPRGNYRLATDGRGNRLRIYGGR